MQPLNMLPEVPFQLLPLDSVTYTIACICLLVQIVAAMSTNTTMVFRIASSTLSTIVICLEPLKPCVRKYDAVLLTAPA